jgi:hypothetical protein
MGSQPAMLLFFLAITAGDGITGVIGIQKLRDATLTRGAYASRGIRAHYWPPSSEVEDQGTNVLQEHDVRFSCRAYIPFV